MSNQIEIDRQVYEGVTPYKTTKRAVADCDSYGRKLNGGEYTSPNNSNKGRSGKHKKNYVGHPINWPTGEKTCLLHRPGHSSEECKLLK